MKRVIFLVLLLLTLVACQTSQTETRTERVNYSSEEIIYQEDESLLVGQEKTIQEAIPGSKEVVTEITTDRGTVTEKRIVSEKVIVEAKPAIVNRGVKEVKRRTEEETITPPTEAVYQDDATLDEGVTELVHPAQEGRVEVVLHDIYLRGKLVKTEEVRRREIQPALAETYRVGTKVVAEEPAEPTPPPVTPVPPTSSDYSQIPNTDYGWWYQPGPPSTISGDVASILSGHRVYWQLSPGRPVVYLTFDEGYEFGDNTAKILDTLKAKGVKATFFLTGGYVDVNPGLVQRMIDEGHQLGNHTIHHYRASNALAQSDATYIQDVVELNAKVPSMTKLHRPPEGGYSERSLQILDDLGYTAVFWSFAYRDWLTNEQPEPEVAKQTILSNLHPGSILLLHAVSNTNTAILGEVIDGIYSQGYTIELLPVQ